MTTPDLMEIVGWHRPVTFTDFLITYIAFAVAMRIGWMAAEMLTTAMRRRRK